MANILKELNSEQLEAVKAVEGPVMVFAGAGTGKTKTLIARIIYMIEDLGIAPKHILAITFTNKATKEMRERISFQVDAITALSLNISTIHSLCARILRKYIIKLGFGRDFEIIDDEEMVKTLTEILNNLNIDKKSIHPRAIAKAIGDAKNGIRDLKEEELKIYDQYQKYLKENNLVDFDDLLVLTLELLRQYSEVKEYYQNLFEYILVDEFQDTNKTQYEIVKLLGEKNNHIFVVGDDDQSIYSFRGACIDNMFDFIKDFPQAKVFKLVQNYRSTECILKGANALIKNNVIREAKELRSDIIGKNTDVIVHGAYYYEDEVRYVLNEISHLVFHSNYQYSDIAILYRNNALSRNFEFGLIEANMPYKMYGGYSYLKRKEVKDVLSYLRFIVDNSKTIHFKRIINNPPRGIGDKTIQNVLNWMEEKQTTLFEAIDQIYEESASTKNQALKDFKKMIEDLSSQIETMDLQKFFELMLEKTGYLEVLRSEDSEEKNRLANVEEFKSILYHVDQLYENADYSQKEKIQLGLDELVLDQSTTEEETGNAITLSTIHSVKGLEFKVVFLVALEEGIFPAMRGESDIEEERRVAYVAVTRAKEKLYLTSASRRLIYGRVVRNQKSCFLVEFAVPNEIKESIAKQEEKTRNEGNISVGDKIVHTFFGYGLVIGVDDKFAQILFEKDNTIRKITKDHPTISRVK